MIETYLKNDQDFIIVNPLKKTLLKYAQKIQ